MSLTRVTLFFLALFVASFARGVIAGPFFFTKIADTNTVVPGGTGTFRAFAAPVLDGDDIGFLGFGTGAEQGIYTTIGGPLRAVADKGTSVPDGSGQFTFFTGPSIANGNLAFGAGGTSAQQGVFTGIGGVLDVLANTATAIPSGTGNFTNLTGGAVSIDGEDVAFIGHGDLNQKGVYKSVSGSLTRVADGSTSVPGAFTPSLFAPQLVPGRTFKSPSIDDGNVVFGSPDREGIYTDLGGSLRKVADDRTFIPGPPLGTFDSFGSTYDMDGSTIVFTGARPSFSGLPSFHGIVAEAGGALGLVAERGFFPGSSFFVSGLGDPSTDSGHVAFRGTGGGGTNFLSGIFTNLGGDGEVISVIDDVTGILDGKSITNVATSRESISGNSIAFTAVFDDGSQGIYLATLATASAPPTLALLLGALAMYWLWGSARHSEYGFSLAD